ncbi:ATP-binding cassette sub-family A member 6 [Araneus ventricosus]|uniref:ATP-binding cassette sub-family A member 6 n=1 Tax=Araneus ventricosus TaxID=182803 RepID=A0A4Y2B8Y8_ARAVE|nr:ATP-binding cassette sub-family A member 6 [Araneus ventricosus]
MLSRGEKRNLCVAIAMIGDPKVLLLDEPSSGMSPPYRRQLWKILQDYTKSGRSVFFTTHDTDEAELFADRVALLFNGKVICYGTTMDIKKQFGRGYKVRITLQSEPSLLLKSELVHFVKDFPSKPKIILKSDCEVVIKLHSFDAATCSDFLSKIEEQFKDFGSDCFTVSVSSLEEIFFLLAAKNTKWTLEEKKTARQNEITKFTYISSTWTNIKELIRARCRLSFRRLVMFFPIMLCIIALASDRCVRVFLTVTKESFYVSPELFENEIIQIINASGKPCTDFEKSLSKLRMKFESVNSTATVGEKCATGTEIQNYDIFNETLEINWNWTTYYKNPFALPVMQNLMSNILWKTFDDKLGRELKIIVQPITIVGQQFRFFESDTVFTSLLISLFLIFMALSLGLEVVKEKERKVIWLLSTTRNNALPYWISTFVVQLAIFSLSLFTLQNLMLIYGVQVFENFSVWIAFYLCIPGCLLTVYLMAQWFTVYQRAEMIMTSLVVTVSMTIFFGSMIAVFRDIPYIYTLNTMVLFLFPIYAPFGLIILLSEGKTVDPVTYGTHWKIACGLLIPLSNLFYALLIIYLKKWKTFQEKKKIQVMNQEAWDKVHNPKSIVDLKSVRKAYTYRNCSLEKKKKVAIKDVSMSFLEGEIFALMGRNGTGKSTLMKLLSFNTGLTSGEISIREKYMESIAYCPEKNTVWFDLTVEEHLRLFAILDGVPIKYADQVVENVMKALLLKNVANRRTGTLSMGTQRKVSIALCLLGNSNLVLLDEPTTGLDPINKHFLWKFLHREFPATSKRTLILTIESSNEAEVNASRIGLFSDGNLRTLGTTKALKKQFNKDFQLNIKMKNEDNKKLKSYLVSEIPVAVEKFHKGVMLQYYIPRQAFKSLTELFTAVAKIQAFEGVENCLITECPLNQIIMEILSEANKQVTGEDEYAV